MSDFEIVFFSQPTEGHFFHYLNEARKKGISHRKFEKLWFEAYNAYLAQIAENNLRKNYWYLVGIVHKNSKRKKDKIAMQKLINKGLEALEQRFETKLTRVTEKKAL